MLSFTEPLNSSDLSIAMSTLEMGVLLTVADGDLDAFARNIAQLKPYYDQQQHTGAAATSSKKSHITGLNLMYLLVDNRLSEFHAELELLTEQEASNPFITFPINLERQLMVGAYDQVLSALSHVPDPSYTFFMENLLQTVRDSIADCVEVTYKTMTIQDALIMMKLDSKQQLLDYVQESRDDWIIQNEEIVFQPPPSGSKASDIPTTKLIAQTLSYATEMDRII